MNLPKLTKEELAEAISEGVRRAFWQMITNATSMPCADFYAALEDGVARGMERYCDGPPRPGGTA